MDSDTPNVPLLDWLDSMRQARIRPTRQRIMVAKLLADKGTRHVTADILHRESMDGGKGVALATIYNTLHEFTEAGLLRRVPVGDRAFFCNNINPHHHFYDEESGELIDVPDGQPALASMPTPPDGMEIVGVEVLVRVRRRRR